ncbi:MAG: thioesterase domain-containing protein [Bacillota bacterium]|nr:thioesterase domain-containing protein [Bacillota bacterium]
MEKIKVYFFPYAGGSASAYLSWKKYIDNIIEMKPIELAGHGKRISEPLYKSIDEAVIDIYSRISHELDEGPYAFYGHSMGTILAYELIRKIRLNNKKEPIHVFFSGRFPPYVEDAYKMGNDYSDEQIFERLIDVVGTKIQINNNKEIRDFLFPILLSDYNIVQKYDYNQEIVNLNCGISILNGNQDSYFPHEYLQLWRKCTSRECSFYEFEGDHFFINQHKKEVSDIINKTLQKLI